MTGAAEALLAKEQLAELASRLGERFHGQEAGIRARDRVQASQLFRAVQLAAEEDGCEKVARLADHQLERSTLKPAYRQFWQTVRAMARSRAEEVRNYLGDRSGLSDAEFRRLLELFVVEILYLRASDGGAGGQPGGPGARRRR